MSRSVSVVIPVYNAEKYLAECLESVFANPEVKEVIVVDDGSTDRSAEVAKRYPVRYLFQENRGVNVARKRGGALATHSLLAFQDADDIWVPHKLSSQIALLEKSPKTALVFGRIENFYDDALSEEERKKLQVNVQQVDGYSMATVLIDQAVFGPISEAALSFSVGEVIELITLAEGRGLRVECLPEVVTRRRIHGNNVSMNRSNRIGYVRALKQRLDRLKKGGVAHAHQ